MQIESAYRTHPDVARAHVPNGLIDTTKLSADVRVGLAQELRQIMERIRIGTDSQADDRRAILIIAMFLGLD
ncbi:MAG: hypothetical protein HY925_02580 [Elusimicrobia bacterium]|nr:hypothetical protein [Elusimicrobiota bacterium]